MDIRAAANALADVLEQIDAAEVEATAEQRAYLAGALDTLESLQIRK